MIQARRAAGVTFAVFMFALTPLPLKSSVYPLILRETNTPPAAPSIPLSKAADRPVFTGAFIARGQTSLQNCRWTETWSFTAVSVDLGLKVANFSGRLSSTPLVHGCSSRDIPVSNQIPINVDGAAVGGSAVWDDYTATISGTISGNSLKGAFQTVIASPWSGSHSGTFNLVSELGISLQRGTLLLLNASGTPAGGRFSYSVRRVTDAGSNVAGIEPVAGVKPTTNPNNAKLKKPKNPNSNGAPAQGGRAEITATYTNGGQASKAFSVATFGLSCYNIAAESEWGTPPGNCRSVRISGVTYSGSRTDPHGLRGVYCASFIAQVRLQGSGQTSDGRKVQYEPTTNRISVVQAIHGADGTPVVAGRTLARDRTIIPRKVLVDIAQVGAGLQANDTGGAIKGYRIDLFKGAGEAVCNRFANEIAVAACRPGNVKCPARKIPD